jgi:anti-sigma B factor antagonist
MKAETRGDTLIISELDRLSAINATWFKELAGASLTEAHRVVEVDLTQARFIDSDGLGALLSVKKRIAARQGQMRLRRPSPMVETMLKLLHMDRVFDIDNS